MKRLLVTGASGFLGWHVCRLAAASWQVYCVVHRPGAPSPGGVAVPIDLTERKRTDDVLGELRPDAVVHLAAVTDPNFCETHRRGTDPINLESPRRLARHCAARNIPFVFSSSDLVFGGDRPPYAEVDAPSPVNVYGLQKARAEEAVLDAMPGALVCRLPLLFGWSGADRKAFDHETIRAIREKRPVRLFTDEHRTPVDARSAAEGLLKLLGRAGGIVHLGGEERISRFDMGLRIAAVMNEDAAALIPVRQEDVPMPASRPSDVSLLSHRARELGYDPLPLDEAIRRSVEHAKDGQPGIS